jgi:hypothetical protein
MRIARCPATARHGLCHSGQTVPVSGGILLILGERLAGHFRAAAFTVAHEARHNFGPAFLVSVAAAQARIAGWLAAGWAVPWPQLLAALAGVQVAYLIIGWITEIDRDLRAACQEGRETALEGLAYHLAVARDPQQSGPLWRLRVYRLSAAMLGLDLHPPLRLRHAIIRVRAATPGPGRSAHG